MQQKLTADRMAAARAAIVDPMEGDELEEEDGKEDVEEDPFTEDLVPKQVPVLQAAITARGFWTMEPSSKVAR